MLRSEYLSVHILLLSVGRFEIFLDGSIHLAMNGAWTPSSSNKNIYTMDRRGNLTMHERRSVLSHTTLKVCSIDDFWEKHISIYASVYSPPQDFERPSLYAWHTLLIRRGTHRTVIEPAKQVLTRRRLAPLTVSKSRALHNVPLRCFTIRQIRNYVVGPHDSRASPPAWHLFQITDFLTGKKSKRNAGGKQSQWEHTRSNYLSPTMGSPLITRE